MYNIDVLKEYIHSSSYVAVWVVIFTSMFLGGGLSESIRGAKFFRAERQSSCSKTESDSAVQVPKQSQGYPYPKPFHDIFATGNYLLVPYRC